MTNVDATPTQSNTLFLYIPVVYNTPQKLDRGIRCMLACHTKKEARYGKKHAERTQWGF